MHRRAFPSDPSSSSSNEKVQQFYRGHFRVVPNPGGGGVTSYSRQPHHQQKQQPSQHQQHQQQQHLMMIANNNRALKESLGISKMSPYHPFICRYSGCGSRYPHIHNLREHDRMHSRIKPFRCRLCGHRSSYQGALMKHLRRRHFPSMTAEDGQTFIAKLSCHVEVDEETLDLEAIEMDQWVASGECRRLLAESDAGGFAINGINPAMRINPESGGGAALRSAEQQQQQPPKRQQLPGNSARVYTQLVQQFSHQQQPNQQHQQPTGSGQSGRLVQVQHKLQPVGQQVQRQAEQVRQQQVQQEVMLKRLQYVQKVMASSSSAAASSSETYLPAKKMKFSRLVDAQQQRSNLPGVELPGQSSILHNRHSSGSSEIDFSSRASAAIAAAAVAAHTTRSAAQLSSSNSFTSSVNSKALVVVPKNSVTGRQLLRQSSTLKRSQLAQVSHQAIVTLNESDDRQPPPAKEAEQQNDQAGDRTATAADASGKDDENPGGQETAEEEVDDNGDQQQHQQQTTAENVDDPAHLTSSSSPVKEGAKMPALPGTPSRATRASISAATEEAAAPFADDASTTTTEHSSLLAKIDRRSLICKHCGRGNFASFRDYTFHDRTHSGLKPYTCTFTLKGVPCSNTFAQRCGVKVHVIKKHKGKRAGVSGAVNSAPFPDCYILEHTALIEAEKIRLAEELAAGIAAAADADAGGD